jgi:hypothetical protein
MLTAARLREVLHYNPATGLWRWLVDCKKMKAGDQAGWTDRGYTRIAVDGRSYRSARLAWLYMTGEWPPVQVDHENTVESDDRWGNLRLATQSGNQANRKVFRNNSLGIKGVKRVRGTERYQARIYANGKSRHLGCFDTPQEANEAYRAAAEQSHGDFARA